MLNSRDLVMFPEIAYLSEGIDLREYISVSRQMGLPSFYLKASCNILVQLVVVCPFVVVKVELVYLVGPRGQFYGVFRSTDADQSEHTPYVPVH